MERCTQCGRPKWICHNEDDDIDVRAYDETCYVARRVAMHNAAKAKDKDRDGVSVNTEVYTRSQTPLVEFREPWYRDQNQRQEKLESTRPVVPRERPPGVAETSP